ncbi:MAG: DUF1295 domain-containing protein [Thermoanaerobaculia bacterium]|nr:DUF1295 domain-containing protein [Thermoanaerobaculia bacterium]
MPPGKAALLALATLVALWTLLWLVSLARRDASIADPAWGPGFVVVAWLYHLSVGGGGLRGALLALLVTAWGLRLALHLLARSHGKGEDRRYTAMREAQSPGFAWKSLFTVFWLQAALIWVVSAPLLAAQRAAPELGWLDLAGGALWLVGVLFETVGDAQLARFRSDPGNRGRVLDTGLWRYTRHPNYFGDACVWWGIFLIAVSVPGAGWTFFGPLLMTFLLLEVSGVSLLESDLSKTKPAYRDYQRRTSAFFPWPPKPEGSG